ncbi:conjugal transfer protein TraH [Providencia rettgeri]|uniref:conjugal transfer protein TraH n=1 Tax=Morganellaceae TaxID=1903414 RepID=UPI00234A5241|nr:conjugal transfer protein TraH [Providencia sp. PROV146]
MKKTLLSLVVTALFGFTPISQSADVNEQLNKMFGSMSNTTSGGSYKSVTREGYVGGGFVVRNQLRTLTPVNVTLPKASGGCAGIDFFAGSFSFINTEEFIQLLRNIAANSVGLAFQLAINAMDAVLGGELSKLQSIIQKLNEYTANSCQLSKGLMVDMAGAISEEMKTSVSAQLSSKGIQDSFNSYKSEVLGKQPPMMAAQKAGLTKPCTHYGNVMWCLLSKGGFNSGFLNSTDEQKELVMSLTGMVIVKEATQSNDKSTPILHQTIAPIPIEEVYELLMKGSKEKENVQIYGCGTSKDTCIAPAPKKIKVDGLQTQFLDIFEKYNYLQKYISNEKAAENIKQKVLFFNVNGAVTNGYKLIDGQDTTRAMHYYRNISEIISYEAAFVYLNDMLTAAESSADRIIENNEEPIFAHIKKQREMIRDAKVTLRQIHDGYIVKHGGLVRINEIFNTFMVGTKPIHVPDGVNAQ